jgi:hypothetical protein
MREGPDISLIPVPLPVSQKTLSESGVVFMPMQGEKLLFQNLDLGSVEPSHYNHN